MESRNSPKLRPVRAAQGFRFSPDPEPRLEIARPDGSYRNDNPSPPSPSFLILSVSSKGEDIGRHGASLGGSRRNTSLESPLPLFLLSRGR